MNSEHISYPAAGDENRTTPTTTPERRPPPSPQTRHEVRLLEQLRTEHGTAFQVYLDHVWNGIQPIAGMDADFDNLHWASYERPEHFVDDFIDSLGWADARDQLLRDWAIPKDVLVFDRAAFLQHLRSDFTFYERDGETHVFVT